MAISAVNLTFGRDGTDATVYTTASITPGANRLILLTVYGAHASGTGTLAAPTISGNGLTWVNIALKTLAASPDRGFAMYRAMGPSPSAGAVTITWAQTMYFSYWTIEEFDGVDPGGTNGSAAVRQIVTADGSGAAVSVTLAAFADAIRNAAYGYFALHQFGGFTPEAGYTELSDQSDEFFEWGRTTADEWRSGEDLDVTGTGGGTGPWVGAAVEIVAAPPDGAHHGAGVEWWR